MKIENSFTVDAPIEQAWKLLTDIPAIAPCLPGAKLTGEEDGVYQGGIKVKVGPVTAEYKGSAEFVEKDDQAYKAVISGKGRDTRGAGNAQALITANMTPVGDTTRVDIDTDLKISGKVAQFGRGVMQDISEKLLGQFAECLETKLGDGDSGSTHETDSDDSDHAEKNSGASDDVTAKIADRASGLKSGKSAASAATATGTDSSTTSSSSTTAPRVPTTTAPTADVDDDDDALDLLDVAGGAMAKRAAVPAAVAAFVILALIIRRLMG